VGYNAKGTPATNNSEECGPSSPEKRKKIREKWGGGRPVVASIAIGDKKHWWLERKRLMRGKF